MIFLIIGLINFSRKSATGLATRADTVATVAIVAVVVTASSGGRYCSATWAITGMSGLTSFMHLPSRKNSSCSHRGFEDAIASLVVAV
tara:strand:- start:2674 stop:2937 length:264 start_codon:yes stop_codon:yes gene_type:complete